MTSSDLWDEDTAERYEETSAEMFTPDVLDPAVDFLARLAGSGPALELAIGTGRVAVPLLARGVPVTGIELSQPMVDQLRRKAINRLMPDVTLLLDLPVETGLARAAAQQRYERMGREFHEKLRAGFLDIAAREPQRVAVINAAADTDTVFRHVWERVSKLA